jgi:hypothetical protein
MKMKLPVRIKLVERKLGREKAHGLAHQGDGVIEIDPKQDSKERLDTILHEGIHILDPNLPKMKVRAYANRLSDLLWKDRWRRMEK